MTGMEGTRQMVHSSAIGSTNSNPPSAGTEPRGAALSRSYGRPEGDNDVTIDMRVAQLLCSRLCHDLSGASGAIHNGIELMSEDGGADPAALPLVAASATNLNNRLAFYRVAFGLGGGAERTMTLAEAKELARGVFANHRMQLDWPIEPREGDGRMESLEVDEIRLTLGLILIGADALPRGGTLYVRCAHQAAGTDVSVVARGIGAGFPVDLRAALNLDAPADSLTSRTVHGYFAAALARRLDASLAIESTDADELTLTVSLPRSRRADPIPFRTAGRRL